MSSKIGTIVDPKGFLLSYFLAEDLKIKQKVPDGNGNFAIKGQILITPIKNDRLIEKVFEYKYFRGLSLGLPGAIAIEIKSKVDFIVRILADFVSQNVVLIDDSLKVDTNVGFTEVLYGEKFHEILCRR